MILADQFLQLADDFIFLSFGSLIEDDFSLSRGFDQETRELGALVSLESKLLELLLELVDGDF